MIVSPARRLALRVLAGFLHPGDTPVQAELDSALRLSSLSVHDRALATELVYGVLRLRSRLDLIVNSRLARPDKTVPAMRLLLAMAVYELLYLERIPVYATVSAAVDMAREELSSGAAKAVNGVLRALMRDMEADAEIFSEDNLLHMARRGLPGLAQVLCVPQWILKLWKKAYGEEMMRRYAAASCRIPWSCIRVNPLQAGSKELIKKFAATPGARRIGAYGVQFPPGQRPSELPTLVQTGRVSIQGAGSLLALESLGLYEAQGVLWDACAGRGGKTFALLEQGVSVAFASDTSMSRIQGLQREAVRLGIDCPLAARASAAHPPLSQNFRPDIILVDAPCSGLGTLARHPDLRMRRRPEHLDGLIDIQADILEAAWRQLPPGGRLAFITCTLNSDENEHQIQRLMEHHPEAELCMQKYLEPDDAGTDMMFTALLEVR